MAISKDDIVKRNCRITNNNAIDMLVGTSHEQPGAERNVTSQQLQKYERGATGPAHHSCWISVEFSMYQSLIFSMICRKAQCAVHQAGSPVATVKTS